MKILLLAILTFCATANTYSQNSRWGGGTIDTVQRSFYVMKNNQRFLLVSTYTQDSIRSNSIYLEDLDTYTLEEKIISLSKALAIASKQGFRVKSTRLNYPDSSEVNVHWHLIGPEQSKHNFIDRRRTKTTWDVLIIDAKTGEFIEIKHHKRIGKARWL